MSGYQSWLDLLGGSGSRDSPDVRQINPQATTIVLDDERAVRHEIVSRLRLDSSEPLDVVREENRHVLMSGINYSNISEEAMKDNARKVCAALSFHQKRRMSLKGIRTIAGEREVRIACGNRDSAGNNDALYRTSNKPPSQKCNCTFGAGLTFTGRINIYYHNKQELQIHHPNCPKKEEFEIAGDPLRQRQMMSPGVLDEIVSRVATDKLRDGNLSDRNHRKTIMSMINAAFQFLPDMYRASRSLVDQTYRSAKLKASGGVEVEKELDALFKLFETQDHFQYSCLKSESSGGSSSSAAPVEGETDVSTVPYEYDAVSWIDQRLLPPDGKYAVFTSDVTFNMTDGECGFNKYDAILAITAIGLVHVVVQSVIRNEKARTFEHNFRMLLRLFPHLAHETFVLVIDGDPAKISAAKKLFINVVIVLCLYHLTENMKARGGMFGKGDGGEDEEEDGDEAMKKTYVCNCRKCGREMPFDSNFDISSAATIRCSQCNSAESSMGGTDIAEPQQVQVNNTVGTNWFQRAFATVTSAASSVFSASSESTDNTCAQERAACAQVITSETTWRPCWYALRNAATMTEVKERIDLVVRYNPHLASYMGFMWRNAGMWAKCAFVWRLTFQ
jgi:hypothetical protein